jgi:hypothetical protein
MGTNTEFEVACRSYEEAIALYEAARRDFEAIAALVGPRLRAGRAPTQAELIREEQTRAALLGAIRRLDIRKSVSFSEPSTSGTTRLAFR